MLNCADTSFVTLIGSLAVVHQGGVKAYKLFLSQKVRRCWEALAYLVYDQRSPSGSARAPCRKEIDACQMLRRAAVEVLHLAAARPPVLHKTVKAHDSELHRPGRVKSAVTTKSRFTEPLFLAPPRPPAQTNSRRCEGTNRLTLRSLSATLAEEHTR